MLDKNALQAKRSHLFVFSCSKSKLMTGSSQGGAEAVPSENQLDRILLFVRAAEGGARAP